MNCWKSCRNKYPLALVGFGNRRGRVTFLPKHGYGDIDLNSVFVAGSNELDGVLDQVTNDSERCGRKPMLRWKRDRKPWLAFVTTEELDERFFYVSAFAQGMVCCRLGGCVVEAALRVLSARRGKGRVKMKKTGCNREQAVAQAMHDYIADQLDDDIADDVEQVRFECIATYEREQLDDDMAEELADLRSQYIDDYIADQLNEDMEADLCDLRAKAIRTERERLEAMTDEQLAADLNVEIEEQ